MEFITLPEKCVKLKLRRSFHCSFNVNNESLLVLPEEEFLSYVLKIIKASQGKTNKEVSIPIHVEKTWLDLYYRIILKSESSFKSRFLGKELLYRRLLYRVLFPKKNLFGKEELIDRLEKDSDYPFMKEFINIVNNNKEDIIFTPKNCKKVRLVPALTPLEFFNRIIITFPFELKSYKFWIQNIMLYNIGVDYI